MRRHLLLVTATALALLVGGLPVEAGAGTYVWTAGFGTHDTYGTIRISAQYAGSGSARVTLRNLIPGRAHSIEVRSGACSANGARLFSLGTRTASIDGRIVVTVRLSTATMDKVRTATWGTGQMSVRLTRGRQRLCATFVEPEKPWGTPTPTPTPDPVAAGTIDWDLSRCPTAAEVASVNADVPMTWLADPTAGTLVCTAAAGSADLTRFQERVYQAILSMKRVHFDAPLPWTSQSLYDWFVGAIDGITFLDNGGLNGCCSPAHVINIQATANSVALTTNRWIKPSLSEGGGLVYLVQLLLHEARHSDGWPHTCGIGGDNTIAEMGAWAIVYYYYYRWLALHGDQAYLASPADSPTLYGYTPADFYRQTMLNQAESIRTGRFCQEPG